MIIRASKNTGYGLSKGTNINMQLSTTNGSQKVVHSTCHIKPTIYEDVVSNPGNW